MCTYSQLKKNTKKSMAPLMYQNCTRLAEKISQNVFIYLFYLYTVFI